LTNKSRINSVLEILKEKEGKIKIEQTFAKKETKVVDE